MKSAESNPQGRLLKLAQAVSPADLEAVRTLFLEYATELGLDLEFQGFAEELRNLPGRYAPPRGQILLAWCGTDAAGCAALRPLSDSVCEMKRMFVRPDFRRSGLGRLMATQLIAAARAEGYDTLCLDTLQHMTPALRLYLSLGFQRCAPYYHNPLPDVVYLNLKLTS